VKRQRRGGADDRHDRAAAFAEPKAAEAIEVRRALPIAFLAVLLCAGAGPSTLPSLDPRFAVGPVLFHDDFDAPSDKWTTDLERGGTVDVGHGRMDIDVPAGATAWFRPLIDGPVLIDYQATAVGLGGPNDRVSDLNCFWMARDARDPGDLFAVHRSGKFADYNPLLTYYVGLGGNGNTTTRFRRYVGSPTTRPILPQHDLRTDLLVPNVEQHIQLVADGRLIQFYRNGRRLFELDDPHPYTSGWFGFRTTASHLVLRSFSVRRLLPTPQP
jgi:hypothetical protein